MDLRKFIDKGYEAGGMLSLTEAHKKGLCVNCKKPATFYSEAGRREWRTSGMCEPCFDEMFKEEE